VIGGIPPAWGNHRQPTADDTPACAAGSSLDDPRAIASQTRIDPRGAPSTVGRRPQLAAHRPNLLLPLANTHRRTPPVSRCQRRLESAQYTSLRFGETLLLEGLIGSIGSVGDAVDNALAKATIGLYKTESCARDPRSAPDRSPPSPTWNRSPRPGCTGATPPGSCTASADAHPAEAEAEYWASQVSIAKNAPWPQLPRCRSSAGARRAQGQALRVAFGQPCPGCAPAQDRS
jgi:hypothetical protein